MRSGWNAVGLRARAASLLVAVGVLLVPVVASAGTVSASDDPWPWQEPDIPDFDGSSNRYSGALSRDIVITDATAGSVVASVDVTVEIDHTYVGDLLIWLEAGGRSADLRQQDNDSSDRLETTYTVDSTFDGLDPNRTWTLYIKDMAAEDTGSLDAWHITIMYEDTGASCYDLGYEGECSGTSTDGDCTQSGGAVWECVDAGGGLTCWEERETCWGDSICQDGSFSAATCIDEGSGDYCDVLGDYGLTCSHGQADCDGDGECSAGLECMGPIAGSVDGCCWPDEQWDGNTMQCIAADCASLGYSLGSCGSASSDGDCSDDGSQVLECVDAGEVNCWTVRESCIGSEICFDSTWSTALCIDDGHGDYCAALTDFGDACGHGESDCDGDNECAGSLECMGPIAGSVDGCCWPDEVWDGATMQCITTDCASLGYPLGACGGADSDGECTGDFMGVVECVNVGSANCWVSRDECIGSEICFDGLWSAAACIPDGHEDYCHALTEAGLACGHGQADCDGDGECSGSLVCKGPIGGTVDGCCNSDEEWDGTQCVAGSCADLGYPYGECGSTGSDGDCSDDLGVVLECTNVGVTNCWTVRETCTGTEVCFDSTWSAATCIDDTHEDYCHALTVGDMACEYGQSDCDGDSECAGDLVCKGPIGGSTDGCCLESEEWDGTECVPSGCADLGYPHGECGSPGSDGDCSDDLGLVLECTNVGVANCWVARETCSGTSVCFDSTWSAATCIPDGHEDYCAALVDGGMACGHDQADCDGDGQCEDGLECMGPIGGTIDGCCLPEELWDGTQCVPSDCASLGYPLGACGSAGTDGECSDDFGTVLECTDIGVTNCWVARETCTGSAICFDSTWSAALCIDDGHEDYCAALVDAGLACGHEQADCDGDGECAEGLECMGPIGGTIDGCCMPDEAWDGTQCVPTDCASLGFPLGPCGSTGSDGECSDDYAQVLECVDAGPVNCWIERDACEGTAICWDSWNQAAQCVDDGHEEYCAALGELDLACEHGQADCDGDGECAEGLECMGPIGGSIDGCCSPDEDWNGFECIPRDCAELGYPLGPCGSTGSDGECSENGGEVWECVDAGPLNCWTLRETCMGGICFDSMWSAAACIPEGHEDYCNALTVFDLACGHGQSDCDGDGECAEGLECQGPIGGSIDGCCGPEEEWDGATCVPTDCASLGYPLGGCGSVSDDGDCSEDFRQVLECVDAGPRNCWQLLATCEGTAICQDTVWSAAACIDDGHEDYCAQLASIGQGCGHGSSDCDWDSECLGELECMGPIGGSTDGCCYPGEEWEDGQCVGGDCQDECAEGSSGCDSASRRWYCGNDPAESPADTCLDKIYENCGQGETCADGRCSGGGMCEGPGDCEDWEFCAAENICVTDECPQGDTYCRGPQVVECTSSGSDRRVLETCGIGQGCLEGACVCLTDEGCSGEQRCPVEADAILFADFEQPVSSDPEWQPAGGSWNVDIACALDPANVTAVGGVDAGVALTAPAAGGCARVDGLRDDLTYGAYRARIQTSGEAGAVAALFLRFPGAGDPSIDIAIHGAERAVEFSVRPRPNATEGIVSVPVEFPPAEGFHLYGFDWRQDRVDFYIDEHRVATISTAAGHPNTVIPSGVGALSLLNLHGAQPAADAVAVVDWVSYTPWGGTCSELVCAPGEVFCDGRARRQCNADGSDSTLIENCPANCSGGVCIGACGNDGDCQREEFCAENGECTADLCPQNDYFCDGDKRMRCNANGSGASVMETCPYGCESGACVEAADCSRDTDCERDFWCSDQGVCEPDVCPQGRPFCEGNERRLCFANGSGSDLIETCQGGCDDGACVSECQRDDQCQGDQYCDGGACLPDICPQGDLFCDGAQLRQCAANGSDSTLVQDCPHGCADANCLAEGGCSDDRDCQMDEYCHNNECMSDVCQQGRTYCDGQRVVRCNLNGSEAAVVDTCQHGCESGACLEQCSIDADCQLDEVCDDGVCRPDAACGDVPWSGCCDGDTVEWCHHGDVDSIDCGAQGLTCGWDPEQGWYWCVAEAVAGPSEFGFACPGACTPNCDDSMCGDDGCGGSCGECFEGTTCEDGVCVNCEPQCAGRECGDNGCGGTCGACAIGSTCDEVSGSCVSCTADCSGRECGDNGCGGSCGSCADGFTCSAEGACVCVPDCRAKQCGDDGCGGVCGECGADESCDDKGVCVADACVPECDGKQCGDDGCGGVCGECNIGDMCNSHDQCVPEGGTPTGDTTGGTGWDIGPGAQSSGSGGCSHGTGASPAAAALAFALALLVLGVRRRRQRVR